MILKWMMTKNKFTLRRLNICNLDRLLLNKFKMKRLIGEVITDETTYNGIHGSNEVLNLN